MNVFASRRALKPEPPRPASRGILCAALLLPALLPAALHAQTLNVDLLRMSGMLSTRYYIAQKGELPPGYILLGGKTNTADSVGTFLFPNPLESAFDLRNEYVEYDEGTGLIFRFRVPGDYNFFRKEGRRELFYYFAPRDVSIPGLDISIERVDDRAREIETASLKSNWVDDVRYNLFKERVEKAGKGLLSTSRSRSRSRSSGSSGRVKRRTSPCRGARR
jgi:hypothetical protein